MGREQPSLGSSLPVPCVQDLVKQPLTSVPSRYIRTDQDPPLICDTNSSADVPIIDLLKLLSEDSMDSELQKLHHACKEWGFFQLINHGVSNLLMEKVKVEIPEFFKLPLEEKEKYWQQPGEVEGFGQTFVMSEKQKLSWGDMFTMYTHPTYLRQHLCSKLPLPLRDTMEAYSTEVKNLSMKILNKMAQALKMDPNDMNDLFEEGFQVMRMNHYPPCPQPELVMGHDAHSDASGITILFQLNEVGGLQIKKDGSWVPIKPLPNAFIINVGEVLEIATNGIYPSIEHRAIVNSEKERFSLATFYNANLGGEFGPAPSLITPETPAIFRRTTCAEYIKGYLSRQLRGKSYLDNFRIKCDNGKSY